MKGGLASARDNLHLSAVQLFPADLEIGLCASLANGVDGLMLCNMKVFQRMRSCMDIYASLCDTVDVNSVAQWPLA